MPRDAEPTRRRDADATRQRLLEAATAEFAAYGIAGARVDRIAEAAGSNKAQIYHYYGSKDELFDAVFDAMCVETLREVPIDPADLPGYAGRLFDSYEQRPYVQRLATWYRLERAGVSEPIAAVLAGNKAKVAAIAAAQRQGTLPTTYSAVDLLGLVLHISSLWASMVPEYDAMVARHSRVQRRKVVVDAVATLISR
jgi:AcrR family transcriptional regulator